jgi:hypothetical protein
MRLRPIPGRRSHQHLPGQYLPGVSPASVELGRANRQKGSFPVAYKPEIE